MDSIIYNFFLSFGFVLFYYLLLVLFNCTIILVTCNSRYEYLLVSYSRCYSNSRNRVMRSYRALGLPISIFPELIPNKFLGIVKTFLSYLWEAIGFDYEFLSCCITFLPCQCYWFLGIQFVHSFCKISCVEVWGSDLPPLYDRGGVPPPIERGAQIQQ